MVSLKRHLLLLVLGALVPLLALAVALALLFVREDRARTEQALAENARLLSRALDAELARSLAALQVLSRSDNLQRGDLQAFYDEAKDVRDSLGIWHNVLVMSPAAEHLLNLRKPLGEPLPKLNPPSDALAILRAGQPYISNAVPSVVAPEWVTYLAYPSGTDGQVTSAVVAVISSEYWSKWLAERAPEGYIASIIDREHVILGRSIDAARLVGEPVQPWFKRTLAESEEGTVRGEGVLDPDVVVAFHRSDFSGWHVNVLTSASALGAPARRTAALLAVGLALALGLAVALALARAAVLTRGIRGLQEALEGLKAERPGVPQVFSQVSEIDSAIAAAHGTAQALRARQEQIDALQAGLRAQAEGQRLLVALHDATRGLRDPVEVMYRVEALVAGHFAVSRCTYGEVDAAQEHVTVARDYVEGVPSIAGRHRMDDFGPQIVRELKAGRTLALPDLAEDPRTSGAGAQAAFAGINTRSLLCVPLVKEGRFVAVLVLHHRAPRAWSAGDIALVEQVAERTWFAVENARIEADLRQSRDVLALAMRGGRMGAWSRNFLTGEVWWSPELEQIFGVPPGSFAGTEEGFLAFVHPEDRPAVLAAVSTAITERKDYVVEFRFRGGNGEWRWMDGRGRAIYTDEGQPRMLYGVGIDITERKRIEQELRRANEELSATDRRKDEFLATLAHELRNPLAPLRSAADLLKRADLPSAAAQAARDIIDRQTRHMTRLVDDLLEVARITHGEVQLKKAPMALADAVRGAVEAVHTAFEQAGVKLCVELPEEPLVVEADSTRLTQVLVNLLGNAAKFTPRGGHVWLAAQRDGAWIEVRLRDEGIGIDPAQLPSLFQMFSQAAPALERTHGGLGIGLALVRGLIERHGGTVQATSAGLGKGAEFIVRLPAALSAPAPTHAVPQAKTHSSGKRRVLLADDNRDAADSLAALLGLMGHDVKVAYDGEDALAVAASFQPQAVILDIGMPKLNGYAVASQFRERFADEAWAANAVLIALTGWGQARDKARAAESGFDHHLTKPVDQDAIERLLA